MAWQLYIFLIYLMTVFQQHKLQYFTFMLLCIVTNFFLIKPTEALIFPNVFFQETLHVSGSSSAHHQEFSTVHSALVCHASLMTYTSAECTYSGKLLMMGRITARNM